MKVRHVSAVAGTLLAAALCLLAPSPAVAQETASPEETAAYLAFHKASQEADIPGALEAAKAYLEQYPQGQYAEFIGKWQDSARMTLLDSSIKERKTADMVKVGREILAKDPENLNVIYALAYNIRRNELLEKSPVFTHLKDGVEFASKGISLVESGKTLVGVPNFDKDSTLAWMTQILAIDAAEGGDTDKAIELYEKSTAYAPTDATAARNLLAVVILRQGKYGEAAKAYNALPEEDRGAAEPGPEVQAARDVVNAEADGLIDAAAGFVAYGRTKGLPAATVDKVNEVLETVYKGRFPEDTELEGLKKILADKGAPPA